MTWVDPLPLIRAAQQGGCAVGLFDMHGVETTEALAGAAERSRSTVFLEMGCAIVPHPGLAAAADTTRRMIDTALDKLRQYGYVGLPRVSA